MQITAIIDETWLMVGTMHLISFHHREQLAVKMSNFILGFLLFSTILCHHSTMAVICYINMGQRNSKTNELLLMEQSACGTCSTIRRYKRFSEPDGDGQYRQQDQEISTAYICFSMTSSLNICKQQCWFLNKTSPPDEYIGECVCCDTNRCNDSSTNRLNLYSVITLITTTTALTMTLISFQFQNFIKVFR